MLFSPYERCNWMMEIRQVRPIGQIVWPGTHNSATNDIGIHFITRPFGQHQTLSIYHQLRNGVRVLDIRVQQDRLVCNGSFLSYNIDLVLTDIKRFFAKTEFEIIILEIRTECGYTDPPNFERYLVDELGDLLIHHGDSVFLKTISQVLPKRIICVWKPKNSPKPRPGGPIWSASYLRDDKFEIELLLTKLEGNLSNLSEQCPASERNFYRVENTVTPQTSSTLEWLLVWPKHAGVISKSINGFARLFLAKCNTEGVLSRLQIYSTDFIDDDFITACVSLNHAMYIQKHKLDKQARKKNYELFVEQFKDTKAIERNFLPKPSMPYEEDEEEEDEDSTQIPSTSDEEEDKDDDFTHNSSTLDKDAEENKYEDGDDDFTRKSSTPDEYEYKNKDEDKGYTQKPSTLYEDEDDDDDYFTQKPTTLDEDEDDEGEDDFTQKLSTLYEDKDKDGDEIDDLTQKPSIFYEYEDENEGKYENDDGDYKRDLWDFFFWK